MAKASTPKRPTRDEFELEELGNQFVEGKNDGDERLLTVLECLKKYAGESQFLIRVQG